MSVPVGELGTGRYRKTRVQRIWESECGRRRSCDYEGWDYFPGEIETGVVREGWTLNVESVESVFEREF